MKFLQKVTLKEESGRIRTILQILMTERKNMKQAVAQHGLATRIQWYDENLDHAGQSEKNIILTNFGYGRKIESNFHQKKKQVLNEPIRISNPDLEYAYGQTKLSEETRRQCFFALPGGCLNG